MKKLELNKRELLIFNAVVAGHRNAGGDFTYADEVYSELDGNQFSMNQIKGYLSQLVQKGIIYIDDSFHQIQFCQKAIEVQNDLLEHCDLLPD